MKHLTNVLPELIFDISPNPVKNNETHAELKG